MSEAIKVGDLVMIVRGHECAIRLKGGMPWRVTAIRAQRGGGWSCSACGARDLGHLDAFGAAGCSAPPGIRGDPNGAMPLSWLKRIPPIEELEGVKTQEPLKEGVH